MKLFGLIGYPLGHSFSAGYFSEKFKREKITDSDYLNFPIPSIEEFPKILKDNNQLLGLNVTIPYKEKVISYMDELDPVAEEIGAVNTIKIYRDYDHNHIKCKGFNTDGYGFLKSLAEHKGFQAKNALVLGSGGASQAVLYSLKKIGIIPLIVSRNRAKGDLSYSDINAEILKKCKLIVNTTPLGTFPDTDRAPDIPYKLLNSSHFLHDLVYNPAETLFMKKGKEQGAKTMNGLKMLVGQAEKSWEIWNQS